MSLQYAQITGINVILYSFAIHIHIQCFASFKILHLEPSSKMQIKTFLELKIPHDMNPPPPPSLNPPPLPPEKKPAKGKDSKQILPHT